MNSGKGWIPAAGAVKVVADPTTILVVGLGRPGRRMPLSSCTFKASMAARCGLASSADAVCLVCMWVRLAAELSKTHCERARFDWEADGRRGLRGVRARFKPARRRVA